MTNKYTVTLCSPIYHLIFEDVNIVTIPGYEGQIGVMANHAPLITQLKSGVISVRSQDQTQHYYIKDGIADISLDQCSIITSSITNINEISSDVVGQEIKNLSIKIESEKSDNQRFLLIEQKEVLSNQLIALNSLKF